MLQCVPVCCSVLQCVAVCCSVLQCVAVCCSVWLTIVGCDMTHSYAMHMCVVVFYGALQCVAVRCNVLQWVARVYIIRVSVKILSRGIDTLYALHTDSRCHLESDPHRHSLILHKECHLESDPHRHSLRLLTVSQQRHVYEGGIPTMNVSVTSMRVSVWHLWGSDSISESDPLTYSHTLILYSCCVQRRTSVTHVWGSQRDIYEGLTRSAQGWTNRTLAVHERVDSRFLVLPGSESTITEITEFIYFSLLKPSREFKYKSE